MLPRARDRGPPRAVAWAEASHTLSGMEKGALTLPLEIEEIKAILPHRYPFLLVDRILELEVDRRIVGVKNVTSNERYFIAGPGGVPTLPATILTEAMAQVGAVLILSKPENRSRLVYFMGIDRVRYRRPVVAGDQLRLEGEVVRLRSKMGTLRGTARVEGEIACEGQMTFALGERPGG
jgi:3-hydroxyacyl-[acyl-carrier-protein] dehydratase